LALFGHPSNSLVGLDVNSAVTTLFSTRPSITWVNVSTMRPYFGLFLLVTTVDAMRSGKRGAAVCATFLRLALNISTPPHPPEIFLQIEQLAKILILIMLPLFSYIELVWVDYDIARTRTFTKLKWCP